MATKRVLITGGAGFVGSNLTRVLLETGAEVDAVDSLITSQMDTVRPNLGKPGYSFTKHDVCDPDFVSRFETRGYDEIFHLACPTGVPNIKILGEEMIDTCSTGTKNVLALARALDAKCLYASSAEMYGEPEVFPQHEGYCGQVDPVGPRSAYEEGKRFGETITRLFAEKYGVDARIIRIFNTYGPNMSPMDQRVIPQFLKRILEGEPLVVYGDGGQKRTFCYADDLIAGFFVAMEKGAAGEVYNIGGEDQLSILDLVEAVKASIGAEVEIDFRPHFINDHSSRRPDTTKIRSLGWQPKIRIGEGLARSYEDMKARVERCRTASYSSQA